MWPLMPASSDSNPTILTSSKRRSSRTIADSEVWTTSKQTNDAEVRISSKNAAVVACNALCVKCSEIADEQWGSEMATTYPSSCTPYVSEMGTTYPSTGSWTSTCSAATEHRIFEDSANAQNVGGDCYNDLDVLCEYRPTKPKTPALAVPSPIAGLRRYLCQKQSGVLMRLR